MLDREEQRSFRAKLKSDLHAKTLKLADLDRLLFDKNETKEIELRESLRADVISITKKLEELKKK